MTFDPTQLGRNVLMMSANQVPGRVHDALRACDVLDPGFGNGGIAPYGLIVFLVPAAGKTIEDIQEKIREAYERIGFAA